MGLKPDTLLTEDGLQWLGFSLVCVVVVGSGVMAYIIYVRKNMKKNSQVSLHELSTRPTPLAALCEMCCLFVGAGLRACTTTSRIERLNKLTSVRPSMSARLWF